MTQLDKLQPFAWPVARLGEALAALAYHSGLSSSLTKTEPQTVLADHLKEPHLSRWIEANAATLGVETDGVSVSYVEVADVLGRFSPAILHFTNPDGPFFLAVLAGNKKTITVLDPDLTSHRLSIRDVRDHLCYPLEAPLKIEIETLLDDLYLSKGRRKRAKQTILTERLGGERLEIGWMLRPQPGHNLSWQLRQANLPGYVAAFLGSYVVQYTIWLLAWAVIGRSALQGRLEMGWLLAWGLLLLSVIPFRLMAMWAQGQIAMKAGAILKQRLMAGALKLNSEEIRHQGAGQFLGKVIEAEAVESLALTGGLLGLVASLELIFAAIILLSGAGGLLHMGLLLVWLGLTIWLGWQYFRRRQTWTFTRLSLTNDLIERMVGHRTRLAQESPQQWHAGEDQSLVTYVNHSHDLDRSTMRLIALIPRGWLAIGLLGLLPAFFSGGSSTTSLAIGLGGLLLAFQAFHKLAPSVQHLAGAAIAWQQVKNLFEAAARTQLIGSPAFALNGQKTSEISTLIEAHRLAFHYRPQGDPILYNCHLQVRNGDRLLLEGPSGGGKSTLASLLTGLHQPNSGLLLLRGLDQQTLGASGWRQRVVAAPQFHENHVLTGTFAFNLLMGRQWPPRQEDLVLAEAICQELGLGELIERMPAGLMQMVGETGWQLSHGERSRLFLARALIQEADLTILDESFAALDPENMELALRCVLDRAKTLMVIAHP